jgi:O-antigen/teichoic acid export membrane protein
MWAGPEYSDAYFIVLILAIPTTVPLIQNIGIEIQRAKNMHRFRSVVYLAIALANIFISIPLTRYYSGIGAAIGTSFALIVGNIIFMNIYYQKRIKLDMLFFWKEITSASKGILIPIITGIIILKFFTITTILQLLLGIACYSIIYVISVWFFSCNSYEKELFIKPISAILKIFRRQR